MSVPAIDFAALRRLSIPERLQLVWDLWDSIAEDAPDEAFPVTPQLAAELERRLEDHKNGAATLMTWEDVCERIENGTFRQRGQDTDKAAE